MYSRCSCVGSMGSYAEALVQGITTERELLRAGLVPQPALSRAMASMKSHSSVLMPASNTLEALFRFQSYSGSCAIAYTTLAGTQRCLGQQLVQALLTKARGSPKKTQPVPVARASAETPEASVGRDL